MAFGAISRPVIGLLSILQLCAAATVIGITGVHMANVDLRSFDSIIHQKVCLLSPDGNTAICMYAYALSAVSMVLTLIIGLLQVCTCNMCGCGAVMDCVFAVLAAGWWCAGGFVISTNATAANRAGIPERKWRDAVAWLTWVNAMLFGVLFAVHILRVFVKYCPCCRRRRGPEEDAEKGAILDKQRPRSAAVEMGQEVRRNIQGGAYPAYNGQHAPLQQEFAPNERNI